MEIVELVFNENGMEVVELVIGEIGRTDTEVTLGVYDGTIEFKVTVPANASSNQVLTKIMAKKAELEKR